MNIGDCKHFTRIEDERCNAGVRYDELVDGCRSGALRLPCLQTIDRQGEEPVVCAKFSAMKTEDEVIAGGSQDRPRIIISLPGRQSPCCEATRIETLATFVRRIENAAADHEKGGRPRIAKALRNAAAGLRK
jgi:hypothetical protein